MGKLSAQGISFGYSGGDNLLEQIDFAVERGECAGIFGANGCGKTTLSLVLAGVLLPQSGFVCADGFRADDEKTRVEFRRRIGYVFQNPEDGFIATEIVREICFSAENFAVPRDTMRARLTKLLEIFELSAHIDKTPLELSGGMKTRLAVASALCSGASFIILDEPESFLDRRGVEMLGQLFERYIDDIGIIHITQTPRFVKNYQKKYVLFGKKLTADDAAFSFSPCTFNFSAYQHVFGEVIVSLQNVCFAWKRDLVIDNVNLEFRRGEIVGLVGASASGKSTLALIIAGLVPPQQGKRISNARVAVAMQFPERQLFADTVFDDVRYAPDCAHAENAAQIAELSLQMVKIPPELFDKSPFALSDGQQRRVGIAGIIASHADVYVFDEPFASLDFDGIQNMLTVFENLAREGASVIIISHDSLILNGLCSRIVALEVGKVVYDGDVHTFFANEAICEQVGVFSVPNQT